MTDADGHVAFSTEPRRSWPVVLIETVGVTLDEVCAARHGTQPGQYAAIAVRDTGIGMDQAALKRVFEPFFTTKPMGQGIGLGLRMVYGFATQSGGHVQIHSEPGVGTTVKLYLPSLIDDAAVQAEATGRRNWMAARS